MQVAHLRGPRELQVVLGQRLVDVLGQVGLVLEVLARRVHVLVAAAARRHHVQPRLLGHGEVARAQRVGEQLVDVEVGGRAAAVPVLDLLQLDVQGARRLHARSRGSSAPSSPASSPGSRRTSSSFLLHRDDLPDHPLEVLQTLDPGRQQRHAALEHQAGRGGRLLQEVLEAEGEQVGRRQHRLVGAAAADDRLE